ncbi:MAG: hypothetical protein ABIR66_12505 [Saprospiraceae bacterium]
MKFNYFLVFLGYLTFTSAVAQSPMTLKGKVVELLQDRTKPVPGVVVSVSGESYDVTGQDGSFKLFAPQGLDFVTITIKGTQDNVISPYEGKVSLPPMYQPIEIRLCNENNSKLLAKVHDLNSRIKTLQKNQNLSARQVELLHKTMLDTIEHYQAKVDAIAGKLNATEKENNVLKTRISELEKINRELEEKLFIALGEKYSEQQKHYHSITALLNTYSSRIKDLQLALPGDALACASNTPKACDRFYTTIEKYNQARNAINENKDQQLQEVVHYWPNPEVAMQLQKTYSYILDKIHEPLLFAKMNTVIITPLKDRSQGKSKLKTIKKQIFTGGTSLVNELKPMIVQMDEMKLKLFNLLTNSIQ